MRRRVYHLLLRYSDNLSPSAAGTIREHSSVIDKKGYVWLGKFGRSLGGKRIKLLKDQILNGIRTYVYLVKKGKKGYDFHKLIISDIALTVPLGKISFVPAYYRKRRSQISLWVKGTRLKKVSGKEANRLTVASSGTPAIISLAESMSGQFIVILDKMKASLENHRHEDMHVRSAAILQKNELDGDADIDELIEDIDRGRIS